MNRKSSLNDFQAIVMITNIQTIDPFVNVKDFKLQLSCKIHEMFLIAFCFRLIVQTGGNKPIGTMLRSSKPPYRWNQKENEERTHHGHHVSFMRSCVLL
mmetsp:Transcript_59616/g.167075  ORF Transcript_59616/g.167075 Transcript_59616/m.167075 type:complete len:99 (+) Transcript_59616:71-367(+)